MYFALRLLLVADPRPPAGAPAAGAREWWTENPVIPVIFREYFLERERLGDAPEFGPSVANVADATLPEVRSFLSRLNLAYVDRLLDALQGRQQRASVDRVFLTSFGRFWDAKPDVDMLIEAEAWREGPGRGARTLGALAAAERRLPASARRRSCACWPGSSPPTAGRCSKPATPT